jgi:hypothetical protein
MANEFTLADYERLAPDNLNKAVARTWREASPILDMLKFRTSTNLSEKVLRFNSLNNIPWRKVGETFTQSKVDPEPIEERLYFMGAKIEVPYEYVKAASLVDLRASQTEAVMKGTAFAFNTAFFTNTPTADEDALVGMWYRIKNDLGSGQYVDANLDISADTSVTSWQQKTFDVMDYLLSLVDGNPNEKVLFMGKTMMRRVQSAIRSSGLLATTKDQLGKVWTTYGEGGPMLIDAGYQYDQSTPILGDTENGITALTGSTKSSMYCVRFGDPYVAGWCQEMPNAEDVGLTEDRVSYRTVVRFSPGLFMTSPRSAALAYGWTAA